MLFMYKVAPLVLLQTLLKKERIFPCLGPAAFPAFLAPDFTAGFAPLFPKAGDFLAAGGLSFHTQKLKSY